MGNVAGIRHWLGFGPALLLAPNGVFSARPMTRDSC